MYINKLCVPLSYYYIKRERANEGKKRSVLSDSTESHDFRHTHPINGRLSTAWRVLQTEIGLSAPETWFVVGMSSEAQIQVPPFFMLPGQLCPGKLGRNSLKWRK